MAVGISTACFYPMLTENALTLLTQAGMKTVEIFVNAAQETTPQFTQKLRSICDQTGTAVSSIHPFSSGLEPFMLFSKYLRRFEDSLPLYHSYCHMAAELNAKLIVIHGDRRPFHMEEQEYFERYARLAEIGREYGIWVAQENVVNCCGDTPEFFTRMTSALGDDARFVLDIKQSVRCKKTPYDFLKAMGNHLCHIHLSDHTLENTCLLPGRGVFDFSRFFRETEGINCDYILEVYREDFKTVQDLLSAYEFLKNTISCS